MKIGLVLSKIPQYSETFFYAKIKGLQQSGLEPILFVQYKEPGFKECKMVLAPKVYRKRGLFQLAEIVKWSLRILFRYPKQLFRFLKLERAVGLSWSQSVKNAYTNAHILCADVDWLHFGFATIALQSEHVAKAISAKMAVSCRGFDMDVYPLKHPEAYTLIWKNVDKVHVISQVMLEKAYTTGMLKTTPFSIITPAVSADRMFNKVYFNSDGTVNITTIARLHWIKGLIETLEALAIAKQNGLSFKYNIIGSGAEYDNIKFAIHQLNLSLEVKLLGSLRPEEVRHFLTTTDIYIQYSHSEGFCNAVLEAQAAGCLCIVSDGGALPENVLHKQTGWVVPKRKPKLLAKTIQEVINLPDEQKKQVKTKANERVLSEFNLEKQRREFNEFYEE